MSTWTILSVLIIVFSIIMLVIVAGLSYKKMKPTLTSFDHLNARIKQKTIFYNKEIENVDHKVQKSNEDFGAVQNDLILKNINFENFMDQQESFQNSINYLQNHAGEYSKGIAKNFKDEVKDDGPKIVKVFKRAFKKTINKQKKRHKNLNES